MTILFLLIKCWALNKFWVKKRSLIFVKGYMTLRKENKNPFLKKKYSAHIFCRFKLTLGAPAKFDNKKHWGCCRGRVTEKIRLCAKLNDCMCILNTVKTDLKLPELELEKISFGCFYLQTTIPLMLL